MVIESVSIALVWWFIAAYLNVFWCNMVKVSVNAQNYKHNRGKPKILYLLSCSLMKHFTSRHSILQGYNWLIWHACQRAYVIMNCRVSLSSCIIIVVVCVDSPPGLVWL